MSSCARLPSSNILRTMAPAIPNKSAPIRIPAAYEVGVNNENNGNADLYHKTQYELRENTFDPSKFSPPAQFLIKLQMRIGTYASATLGINDINRNSE
jgi:hypothetical protein